MRNNLLLLGLADKAGRSPLSLAAGGGHLDIVKYLVEVHHCDCKCESTNCDVSLIL